MTTQEVLQMMNGVNPNQTPGGQTNSKVTPLMDAPNTPTATVKPATPPATTGGASGTTPTTPTSYSNEDVLGMLNGSSGSQTPTTSTTTATPTPKIDPNNIPDINQGEGLSKYNNRLVSMGLPERGTFEDYADYKNRVLGIKNTGNPFQGFIDMGKEAIKSIAQALNMSVAAPVDVASNIYNLANPKNQVETPSSIIASNPHLNPSNDVQQATATALQTELPNISHTTTTNAPMTKDFVGNLENNISVKPNVKPTTETTQTTYVPPKQQSIIENAQSHATEVNNLINEEAKSGNPDPLKTLTLQNEANKANNIAHLDFTDPTTKTAIDRNVPADVVAGIQNATPEDLTAIKSKLNTYSKSTDPLDLQRQTGKDLEQQLTALTNKQKEIGTQIDNLATQNAKTIVPIDTFMEDLNTSINGLHLSEGKAGLNIEGSDLVGNNKDFNILNDIYKEVKASDGELPIERVNAIRKILRDEIIVPNGSKYEKSPAYYPATKLFGSLNDIMAQYLGEGFKTLNKGYSLTSSVLSPFYDFIKGKSSMNKIDLWEKLGNIVEDMTRGQNVSELKDYSTLAKLQGIMKYFGLDSKNILLQKRVHDFLTALQETKAENNAGIFKKAKQAVGAVEQTATHPVSSILNAPENIQAIKNFFGKTKTNAIEKAFSRVVDESKGKVAEEGKIKYTPAETKTAQGEQTTGNTFEDEMKRYQTQLKSEKLTPEQAKAEMEKIKNNPSPQEQQAKNFSNQSVETKPNPVEQLNAEHENLKAQKANKLTALYKDMSVEDLQKKLNSTNNFLRSAILKGDSIKEEAYNVEKDVLNGLIKEKTKKPLPKKSIKAKKD